MRKIVAAVLSCCPLLAMAGAASPGTVSDVFFMQNGVVMFVTNGSRTGVPSCATQTQRWALDTTTTAGKSQLTGVMTAYATGKPLDVTGANGCTLWSDTESVVYIHISG